MLPIVGLFGRKKQQAPTAAEPAGRQPRPLPPSAQPEGGRGAPPRGAAPGPAGASPQNRPAVPPPRAAPPPPPAAGFEELGDDEEVGLDTPADLDADDDVGLVEVPAGPAAALRGPSAALSPAIQLPSPQPPGTGQSDDFQMVVQAPDVGGRSPLERLEGLETALDESIRRMDSIDRSAEGVGSDVGTVKESISRMEANMRELTSLYDLISTQMNPFIDSDLGAGLGADELGEVPEFDSLFEPTPEVAVGEGVPSAAAPALAGARGGLSVLSPPTDGGARAEGRVVRLSRIGGDSTCLIALMRWMDFLMSRVSREHLPSLLTYYVRIGWISEGIRAHVLDVLRGVRVADGGASITPTVAVSGSSGSRDTEGDVVVAYGKEKVHDATRAPTPSAKGGARAIRAEGWKLSTEDHLKTLIFIERIRGTEVDKARLEDLERDVQQLQKGLEGYFGL